jgi:hypothetical protein
MADRSATMTSHGNYDPAVRPQRSPSLSRANNFEANQPTEPNNGPTANPTTLSSPLARSPSAHSFDMTRHSSRPTPLEDVLDMDIGSFRVPSLHRSPSAGSGLSRGNTLKRQKSLSRRSSLRRSSSARSIRAGSIAGIAYGDASGIDHNSVFYTPIPTSGSPTEILANRFQGMLIFTNLFSASAHYCSSVEKVPKGPHRLLQGGPVVL